MTTQTPTEVAEVEHDAAATVRPGTPPDRHDGAHRTTALHNGAWLRERIDGRWALVVGLTWFVLFQVAAMLEPQTSQEEPAIGVVIALVMWSLIAAMVTGLAMQRRWGMGAALAASGLLTAAVIACPTTGHHTFGAWFYGELACAAALVGVSAFALQRAPHVEREPSDERG